MNSEHKNNPIISVVIPMYNCEEFVPNLLNMFSEQSFSEFEVICVIDGATDGTEAEVKKICENDGRFRYVVRENGGAGAARNTGISFARGKYIIFPDADDQYDNDYLLRLFEAAEKENAEITVCGAVTFDHAAGEKRKTTGFDKSCMVEGVIYSVKNTKHIFKRIDTQLANRLFLLDFINKNRLRFSETKVSNDLFFSKASILSADRIAVIHDDLLTIRRFINPESISSTRGAHSQVSLTEFQKLYKWMEKRDLLKYGVSDYLEVFDVTANYEIFL